MSEPGVMAVPAAAPGITKPVTESAAARHDIAHPSLQMVARSPSPTTPIVWFPHRSSHCLYTGNLAPSPTLAIGAAVTSSITTATSATALQRESPILIGMMKGRRSKSPSTEVYRVQLECMHHCETNLNPERRRTQNGGGELGAWMAGWSRSCDTYQAGCGCGTFTNTSFRAFDRCVGVGVGVGVGMGELVIPPRRMSYKLVH